MNGKVDISDSQLDGILQGLVMRCGTAVIENSLIQINTNTWKNCNNLFDAVNDIWGEDAMLPYAALLIGNSNTSKYQYPSDVKLVNSTIRVIGDKNNYKNESNVHSAYLCANSKKGLGITFRYDSLTLKKFSPRTWEKGTQQNIDAKMTDTIPEIRSIIFHTVAVGL